MLNALFLSLFLLHVVAYVPSDKILLNCGSNTNATDMNGRNWSADVSPQHDISSSRSVQASRQASSVQEVPFMTARIFTSPFTFSFPITSGPKFVRLYFHSTSYPGFNATTASFSVNAGRYTLLKNFSASLTALARKDPTIIREFVLNVQVNALNLTFSPFPASSANAYAFVNGIEIISMPADLYAKGSDVPLVGQSTQFPLDFNKTALELVSRLNVGGKDISPEDDIDMFRAWNQDDKYIFGSASGVEPFNLNLNIKYTQTVPVYTAPEEVYRTGRSMGMSATINMKYNLTWFFLVDSGFFYLVRLHFCEFVPSITGINERVFEIFINNQTVERQADIIAWGGGNDVGNGVAVIKDYVVMVPEGSGQEQDLWLALHPNTASRSKYYDALLNGLEIFKLSRNDGNLAGPNPSPHEGEVKSPPQIATSSKPQSNRSKRSYIIIVVGVLGGVVTLSLVCFFVFQQSLGVKNSSHSHQGTPWWDPASYFSKSTKMTNSSSLPSELCRVFSIFEIKAASNNFDEALLIGVGGFGNVYKGHIDGGATTVAIKRLNPTSQQGAHEFQTEIEMLSKLRHLHLVSLIGYCTESGEMILVYDYMANGSLRDHLYSTLNTQIPWKQRLEICIGAARGLDYLHTGAKHTIIHRDVKSTNILLDEKWVAKVSDFGLSKMGPSGMSQTHVSTVVKGSAGYMDPEYYLRQQLTEKSDVYSFGVVLLEVLCARPAVSRTVEKEQVNLADWARCCSEKGMLEDIVDKKVKGEIAPECLKKYGEIAEKCVVERGAERPSMGEVVWTLEFALQLQQEYESVGLGGGGGQKQCEEEVEDDEAPLKGSFNGRNVVMMQCSIDVESKKQDEVEHMSSSGERSILSGMVFSEILNPKGR